MTADDLYDEDSPLVRALLADASPEELEGEDAAVLAYRSAMRGPRLRRRGLRVASGIGMTAAASTLLVPMTAVTAAAYSAALPHRVQRAAHQLFHRLGVPAPSRRTHHLLPALPGFSRGAGDGRRDPTALRPTDLTVRTGCVVLLVRRGTSVGWSNRQTYPFSPRGGAGMVLSQHAEARVVRNLPLVRAAGHWRDSERAVVGAGARAALELRAAEHHGRATRGCAVAGGAPSASSAPLLSSLPPGRVAS